jgi:hypothetical protein
LKICPENEAAMLGMETEWLENNCHFVPKNAGDPDISQDGFRDVHQVTSGPKDWG